MMYLVVVHRKYEDVSYVGFKELKDANEYMDKMNDNGSVEYVEGPFAVVAR